MDTFDVIEFINKFLVKNTKEDVKTNFRRN